MRRRDFITLLGGTAATWPLVARAQQHKLPIIGYLGATTAAAQKSWADAFHQGLGELGWIQGRTVTIEYRWGEGRSERTAEVAAELVQSGVDVILAGGTEPAVAAKKAKLHAIPIASAYRELERIPVMWKRSLHVGSNWHILAD